MTNIETKKKKEKIEYAPRNIKLTIEYDGSSFHGFQRQNDGLRTVQGELELALSKLTGEAIEVTVAGRTDAGVHAKAQVCNFITKSNRKMINFLDGSNKLLPEDIAVVKTEHVPDDFNSRFSARGRKYEYYILNRRAKSAINYKQITIIKQKLDVSLMEKASQYFVGEHDFSSFRASACQAKSPITELYSIDFEVTKHLDDDLIKVTIHGRAFLHNMIRIMMGCLVDVGLKDIAPEKIIDIIAAKDREAASPTLAPYGLYFVGVDYESDVEVFDFEPKR